MASNHSVTKRNRRPKNKRRKDYTRETMLKLRELEDAAYITFPCVLRHVFTVADIREIVATLKASEQENTNE